MVALVILTLAATGLSGLTLFALVEAWRLPVAAYRSVGRSRAGTVAGILMGGVFGAVYYLLAVRKPVRAAAASIPTAPRETANYRSYRKGDDPWAVSG